MTGQDLKELREKHVFTQQDVADGIGAGRTRISDWETGRYQISKSYQRLLRVFFATIQK